MLADHLRRLLRSGTNLGKRKVSKLETLTSARQAEASVRKLKSKPGLQETESRAIRLTTEKQWADAADAWAQVPSLVEGHGTCASYAMCIRSLRQAGRLDDAVAMLQIAETRHGHVAQLVRESVELAARRGDLRLALNRLDLFRDLAELPKHDYYFFRRAEILLEIDRTEEAAAVISDGLDRFPANQRLKTLSKLVKKPESKLTLKEAESRAIRLSKGKEWAAAADAWAQVPSLLEGRGKCASYAMCVRSLWQAGRLDDAAAMLQIAETRHGHVAQLVREGVELAVRRGDLRLALNRLDLFRDLAELPKHDYYYFRRAEILLEIDRIEEAATVISDGLDHFPANQRLKTLFKLVKKPLATWAETALALVKRRKWQDALEEFKRVPGLAAGRASSIVLEGYLETLRELGLLDEAEAIFARVVVTPPVHPSIIRWAAVIAADRGDPETARARWQLYRETTPETSHAVACRHEITLLSALGRIDDARAAAETAFAAYPDDREIRALRNALRSETMVGAVPEPAAFDERHPLIAHLFADRAAAIEVDARIGLAIKVTTDPNAPPSHGQHIPALLGFREVVGPVAATMDPETIDVFASWGATAGTAHNLCREFAARTGKPLLALEYGFISSPGIAINNVPQCSLVICPGSIYYDATRPHMIEARLNLETFELTDAERARACSAIARVVEGKVTKYNHAPILDLSERLPPTGRPRVLLVDQRYGDQSVEKGLAGLQSFRRMLKEAMALKDHDIVIKIHPDAITGGQGSYLGRLLDECEEANVHVIDYDVNPYSLFEAVDRVFVCTSQFGFEALMAGKPVTCFGAPFYAGWGLTTDFIAVPRRQRQRSVEDLFYTYYIHYSRYFVPDQGIADLEDLVGYIVDQRNRKTETAAFPVPAVTAAADPQPPKVLFIIPSGRYGASGRYMQTLAVAMRRRGAQIMVLAEGRAKPVEHGILWRTLAFDGIGLARNVIADVTAFAPDVVYINGVRTRAQRAAIEIIMQTGARLAMQSEDDDLDVYIHRQPQGNLAHLTALDRPTIDIPAITDFLNHNDWTRTLRVLLDPEHDRWIEPVLRSLCYHLTELHTAIWVPFANRLRREYGSDVLVVPPVASWQDFDRRMFDSGTRAKVLLRYGLDPASTIFFISGYLYPYSNEFEIFVEALNHLAAKEPEASISLVVAGRSGVDVSRIVSEGLSPSIAFLDLEKPSDSLYLEMLRSADVSCSPGLPNTFNEFRLPSRLVKSMAMGQPVLTCETGFGASLRNGENAAILTGSDPAIWAEAMRPLLDPSHRIVIGEGGRTFALEHFHPDLVAERLLHSMTNLIATRAGKSHFKSLDVAETVAEAVAREKAAPLYQVLSLLTFIGSPQIDAVIHVGAGTGTELPDYCRLGASRIVLVEPDDRLATRLEEEVGAPGRIDVRRTALAATNGTAVFLKWMNARTGAPALLYGHLATDDGPVWTSLNLRPNGKVVVATETLAALTQAISLGEGHNLLVLDLPRLDIEHAVDLAQSSALDHFTLVAFHVEISSPAVDMLARALVGRGFSAVSSTQAKVGRAIQGLFHRRR
ncbi:capsular polysaccharide export protein, LipB/KpsS family [Xanthobacter sediminis]